MTTTKGKLLVANPAMRDPNFDRSVVFMLEHTEEGALGVVVNRPTDTDVASALPGWSRLIAHPGVVFYGGPVMPEGIIALVRPGVTPPTIGWQAVTAHVGLVDLDGDPDTWPDGAGKVRIFAGHSGWAPLQLDGELEAGAWLIVEAAPDDPLFDDPDQLWARALARLGGSAAWLANYPDDPALN